MLDVWTERNRQFSGTRRDKSPGEIAQQIVTARDSLGLLVLLFPFKITR